MSDSPSFDSNDPFPDLDFDFGANLLFDGGHSPFNQVGFDSIEHHSPNVENEGESLEQPPEDTTGPVSSPFGKHDGFAVLSTADGQRNESPFDPFPTITHFCADQWQATQQSTAVQEQAPHGLAPQGQAAPEQDQTAYGQTVPQQASYQHAARTQTAHAPASPEQAAYEQTSPEQVPYQPTAPEQMPYGYINREQNLRIDAFLNPGVDSPAPASASLRVAHQLAIDAGPQNWDSLFGYLLVEPNDYDPNSPLYQHDQEPGPMSENPPSSLFREEEIEDAPRGSRQDEEENVPYDHQRPNTASGPQSTNPPSSSQADISQAQGSSGADLRHSSRPTTESAQDGGVQWPQPILLANGRWGCPLSRCSSKDWNTRGNANQHVRYHIQVNCPNCGALVPRNQLGRHRNQTSCGGNTHPFVCPNTECNEEFGRSDNLIRHLTETRRCAQGTSASSATRSTTFSLQR